MIDSRAMLVIVNPASAGGATGRRWPVLRDTLSRYAAFDSAISEFPGHTVDLARRAREMGIGRLVCVGGDGTLNEIVNGLLAAGPAEGLPEIGIIPSGTGSDLARSLGIPLRLEEACRRLASPSTAISDLGVVSYRGSAGPEQRYFVNAAGLGFDAEVVACKNRFNRYVGGTIPYVASLVATLLSYQNRSLAISTDGGLSHGRVNTLVCAIGRYFGGGMQIAPNAVLADGLFDVITIGNTGRIELLRNFPRVYRGTHLQHPKVSFDRARDVRVEAEQPTRLQADGDPLGTTPAHFRIIPGSLTFLC